MTFLRTYTFCPCGQGAAPADDWHEPSLLQFRVLRSQLTLIVAPKMM